jgi:hypothetical protein
MGKRVRKLRGCDLTVRKNTGKGLRFIMAGCR